MLLCLWISFTFETNFNCYTPGQLSSVGYGLEYLKDSGSKNSNMFCFPQNLENLESFQKAISDGIEQIPDGIIKLTQSGELKNTLNCDEVEKRFKEFDEKNNDCEGGKTVEYEDVPDVSKGDQINNQSVCSGQPTAPAPGQPTAPAPGQPTAPAPGQPTAPALTPLKPLTPTPLAQAPPPPPPPPQPQPTYPPPTAPPQPPYPPPPAPPPPAPAPLTYPPPISQQPISQSPIDCYSPETTNEAPDINPTTEDIDCEVLEGLKYYGYTPDEEGNVTLTVSEGDCDKEIPFNIHKSLQTDSMPEIDITECEDGTDLEEDGQAQEETC